VKVPPVGVKVIPAEQAEKLYASPTNKENKFLQFINFILSFQGYK
jgi:hypothetical protein